MFEKYQPPRTYGSSGGALSLTGLESMSAAEKTARIIAVANDMAASIIYIAKQAEAGNLTNSQIIPIYNFIDSILGLERSQTKSLMRELDKQGSRIALMEKQHSRDIEELTKCAMETITQMKLNFCLPRREKQREESKQKRWKQKEEEELVGDKEKLLAARRNFVRQLRIARRWLARRGRGEEFYLGISSGRWPQKEKRIRGRQWQRRWNQVEYYSNQPRKSHESTRRVHAM
ncbi:hypothetical protein H100_08937 [Trichophyton rubrum MR850]|nr:hypothetical protein H100_08937 [Trichophyton rubrum MR850]